MLMQIASANGFVFEEHSPTALLKTVRRALAAFAEPSAWARLMQAGMRADFSWARSAAEYLRVYELARAAAARPAA